MMKRSLMKMKMMNEPFLGVIWVDAPLEMYQARRDFAPLYNMSRC